MKTTMNKTMRLNGIVLNIPDKQQTFNLLRVLPSIEICHCANILVIKHRNNYYLVKVRPSFNSAIWTEEFTIIKNNYMSVEEVAALVKSITGKYIIYDISGWRLEI